MKVKTTAQIKRWSGRGGATASLPDEEKKPKKKKKLPDKQASIQLGKGMNTLLLSG